MYVCNCKCVVEGEEGSLILESKRCSASMFAATWFALEALFKKISLVSVKDAPSRSVMNLFAECHSLPREQGKHAAMEQHLQDGADDQAMLESMRPILAKEGYSHGQFLPSDWLHAQKARQSDE